MSENEQPIRLNLGCGDKPISSYINIDVRKECNPDIVCDVHKLPYENNTVEKIIANDILEHFGRLETADVLREWYRVLKLGGWLIIKTPNIHTIIDAYQTKTISFDEFIRKLYGQQDYKENTHFTGFCPQNLEELLVSVGFKIFNIIEILDNADWSNMAVRCQK